MKTIIIILSLFTSLNVLAHGGGGFKHSDIFKTLGPNDKIAILMVHFGTTHDDTRTLTIETINKKVSQTFPGVEVRESYTSRHDHAPSQRERYSKTEPDRGHEQTDCRRLYPPRHSTHEHY